MEIFMKLETRGLRKKYGRQVVLEDASGIYEPGIHVILGPNGAGKTTYMNIICGLVIPEAGEVLYDDKPVRDQVKEFQSILRMVFQRPPFQADYRAEEALEFYGYLCGIPKRELPAEINRVLEQVNLTSARQKRVKQLSGGMRQRLAIAQMLMGRSELILLDEPSTGLDLKEREELKRILLHLKKDHIILLSTHIISDADGIADYAAILKEGRTIRQGSIDELKQAFAGKVWAVPEGTQVPEEWIEKSYFYNGDQRVYAEQCPFEGCGEIENVKLQDIYFCSMM